MALLSRRAALTLVGGATCVALTSRLSAADSSFWNKKPPPDWTPEEIARLLNESPWAKEVTPTYTILPPPTDQRPWGETPPIRGGPVPQHQRTIKAPYRAIIRWESAEPIRTAQKVTLPAVFSDLHVLAVLFPSDARRDLGSKPIENLKESAILFGARPVTAEIVQPYPGVAKGFLVGFSKTSTNRTQQWEFSASIGLLALRAKFNSRDMVYRGKPAL